MEKSFQEGFSLIEMIVVIAIMAIVAAIAAPNYQIFMANNRLKGAARQVMSDLMLAKQRAISQNNRFKVFFNVSNHEYTILDDDNNNNSADGGEATELRDIQNDYYDVTFSATTSPIFYSRGTAYGTTVTLTSGRTGGKKYVKVATTGRVKISDTP